jgi:ribosomal protein L11 methyltransferase
MANAAANGVELGVARADLRRQLPELAPTTVANLTAPVLREVAARIDRDAAPSMLVCSGLLPSELDDVSAALRRAGLGEAERRREGDWAALLMQRD